MDEYVLMNRAKLYSNRQKPSQLSQISTLLHQRTQRARGRTGIRPFQRLLLPRKKIVRAKRVRFQDLDMVVKELLEEMVHSVLSKTAVETSVEIVYIDSKQLDSTGVELQIPLYRIRRSTYRMRNLFWMTFLVCSMISPLMGIHIGYSTVVNMHISDTSSTYR